MTSRSAPPAVPRGSVVLDLEPGAVVSCALCAIPADDDGGDSGDERGGIDRLPDTGAGSTSRHATESGPWPLRLAGAVLGLGAVAVGRRRA